MAGAKENWFPGPHEGGLGAENGISKGVPLPWQSGLRIESTLKNQPHSPPHPAAPQALCDPAFVPATVPSPRWPPREAKTPLVAQVAVMSCFPEEKAHGSTVAGGSSQGPPCTCSLATLQAFMLWTTGLRLRVS